MKNIFLVFGATAPNAKKVLTLGCQKNLNSIKNLNEHFKQTQDFQSYA